MSKRIRLSGALSAAFVVAAAAGLLLLPIGSASAHEHRVVGNVAMVVGWGNEPTYAGYLNAAEISLSEPGPSEEEEGPPISDAELQVDVIFGDETSTTSTGPLPMEEAFSEPGVFEADLIPTRPGTYTFHFTGTVAGQEVDEFFTSGEDTFSEVNVPADIQFPEKDPTVGELADAIQGQDSGSQTDSGAALWIAIASGVIALIALGLAVRKRPSA